MFLGGADHQATRIRETSVKGALAFWWRALNYAGFVERAGKPDSERPEEKRGKSALALMQEAEQELFGGPKGQGAFLLKVWALSNKKGTKLRENNGNAIGSGAKYFAGQGLLDRTCLSAGLAFVLQIAFHAKNQNLILEEIVPTLKLFGLLGGLGSRVRRGWGSVALVDLKSENIDDFDEWKPVESIKDYKERLKDIIGTSLPSQSGADWLLSAFSRETDIRVGKFTAPNSLQILDKIGSGLQRYRGWQGDGEKNFLADHDWFKQEAGRATTGTFTDTRGVATDIKNLPKRAAFGLPHNYFSRNGAANGANLKMDIEGPEDKKNRRASPLMVHIHKCRNGNAFGALAFFPTLFIEPAKIKINKLAKDFEFDAKVISNYLDGLKPDGSNPAIGDYFPSTPVFP